MEETIDNAFSPREFYYVLFRRKITIAIIVLVTLFTVIVGIYLWPETYQAQARILVKVGRENVSLPTVSSISQHQVVASLGVRKEDINSEIEILTCRPIVEKVVEELGMDSIFPKTTIKPKTFFKRTKYEIKQIVKRVKDLVNDVLFKMDLKKELSPYDKALLALQGMFSAKQVSFSDVIEVRFRWFAPQLAEEILDTWMDLYLVHHLEAHKASGEYAFFEKQVEVLETALRDSEDKLKSLKKSEQITSYENESRLLLEQVSSFKASLKMTETELSETNMRIQQFREKMSSLRERITTGFSTVYREAEKELLLEEVRAKALNAKKQELQRHIKSYLDDIEKLNSSDIELKRLERQIGIDEYNYELYRTKLEEARISDVLDTERIVNVKIIQPAVASLNPVRPKKLLTIGIGIVFSLIFGIGFAFISEYFDHSIRTAEQVSTHLNLPLLASIREGNR